jgi:hypothetical protein
MGYVSSRDQLRTYMATVNRIYQELEPFLVGLRIIAHKK